MRSPSPLRIATAPPFTNSACTPLTWAKSLAVRVLPSTPFVLFCSSAAPSAACVALSKSLMKRVILALLAGRKRPKLPWSQVISLLGAMSPEPG